jgi:hypothetical protein
VRGTVCLYVFMMWCLIKYKLKLERLLTKDIPRGRFLEKWIHAQLIKAMLSPMAVLFNLFRSRTPRYDFSLILYPQSSWCIIQVIHSL